MAILLVYCTNYDLNLDWIWKKTEIAISSKKYLMSLKNIGLQLCTCTWIENMTCISITLYLLYQGQSHLALITVAVMSPLIVFHFAISKLTKSDDNCANNRCARTKIDN
jgi:hypothetical protein